MATPASTNPNGTLLQHTAKSLHWVLSNRPALHALSVITGLATIPLANIPVIQQVLPLDGSRVAALGQAIQNRPMTVKKAVSLASGVAVLAALNLAGAAIFRAPDESEARHKANEQILVDLTNAMINEDGSKFARYPPVERFYAIAHKNDVQLSPNAPMPAIEWNPPPSFSEPFSAKSEADKAGELWAHRVYRDFSNLPCDGVVMLALLFGSSVISHSLLPKMKLNGEWVKAVSKAVRNQEALQLVAAIGSGYVSMTTLKSLAKRAMPPSSQELKKRKLIATLGQLSYAMHVIETRKERNRLVQLHVGNQPALQAAINALPCNKAPLVERFKAIMAAYKKAAKKAQTAQPQPSSSNPPPPPPANTDTPFTQQEVDAFAALFSKATVAGREALLKQLQTFTPSKQFQLLNRLAKLLPQPANPPPAGA